MQASSADFMMDGRKLRVLRELADRGTVTATAAALHLTPSAVSQQIASLAREAGVPLLARVGRGVVLTEQARILLAHADVVHAQLERARHDLAAHARGQVGRITIGAMATAITGLLPRVITTARRQRPGVDVRVVEIEGEQAFTALHHGDLDAAVVVEWRDAPRRDDPRYTRSDLLRDPMTLLMPAGHPLAARTAGAGGAAAPAPLALADLHGEQWITGLTGPCREVTLNACADAGFTADVHHRSADWNAIAALVAAGCGVALIPRLASVTAPAGSTWRPVQPRPHRPISLVTRAGSEQSLLLAPLVRDLHEVAAALSAAD